MCLSSAAGFGSAVSEKEMMELRQLDQEEEEIEDKVGWNSFMEKLPQKRRRKKECKRKRNQQVI